MACIPTSDNQVLVVGKGNYIAESNGWISAYGDAYMVKISPETLSLNENQELTGLIAWPNPSNGRVRITASETIEKITVCDQRGAIIFESAPASTFTEIDLSASPGLYIYKASGKNCLGSGKLIVH